MEDEIPWEGAGSWKAPIDFITLVLIVLAGFELGAIGFFNASIVALLGSWKALAYDLIGLSAIWQLTRQTF
jgi:uncharacterized membrane protein YuzA (DUF378 family)